MDDTLNSWLILPILRGLLCPQITELDVGYDTGVLSEYQISGR